MQACIAPLRERAEAAEQEAKELRADAERLNWLDSMNSALNRHYGTEYGWKLVLSPNVVRLMRDGCASVSGYLTDIDLNDSEGGHAKLKSCRLAIDSARSLTQKNTGGSDE